MAAITLGALATSITPASAVVEGFNGSVNSGGLWSNFTVARESAFQWQSVRITIHDFTSPNSRWMNFEPNRCWDWSRHQAFSSPWISKGGTLWMDKSEACWRFAGRVQPGRDTNGSLSPGTGVTSFNGELFY